MKTQSFVKTLTDELLLVAQPLARDPDGLPRLLGSEQPDTVFLAVGALDDYLEGVWMLGGDDEVTGSPDDEQILLNEGNDIVYGGAGRDQLFGGKEDDQVFGELDADQLRGDTGEDTLDGGAGEDTIRGGKGKDFLLGQDGKDLLVGDRDVDTLTGGDGADIFVLTEQDAATDTMLVDIITDFDWFRDDDKIALADGLLEADLDTRQMIDFDLDGAVNDTLIKLRSTGEILGIVLNVDAFDLDGEFIVADPTQLTA